MTATRRVPHGAVKRREGPARAVWTDRERVALSERCWTHEATQGGLTGETRPEQGTEREERLPGAGAGWGCPRV